MGRKRINKDDDETITITVRNIKKEDWNELGNYIGSRSKSDFIRECINNQINKSDTVTELKKEISELEYQIGVMQDTLASKKQELGEILQRQTDNVDNELMIDTIMKAIKTFNTSHGGISEDKIKSIVREDYNDAIPIQKILNLVKNDNEINIIKNIQVLYSNSQYNPVEKEPEKTPEEIKQDKIKKLEDSIKRWYNTANSSKINSKKTLHQVIDEYKLTFDSRCKNIGLSDKEIDEIIQKIEKEL